MTSMSQVAGERAHEELAPLPYAGFSLRAVSAILDLLVLLSVFFVFVTIAGLYLLAQTDWGAESDITNSEGYAAAGIVLGALVFVPFYFVMFWWWRGQTIGQQAVRVVVTDRDGYQISFMQAVLRTLFWPLSIIPFGLGLVPIFTDRESRALHDMIVSTVVLELP
jgi:uncharacterized RDD family membrane protein YckC